MSYLTNMSDIDGLGLSNTELSTGTTIMAVEFSGGVVVAADSRTTTGSFVSNRFTNKIDKIAENVFCCRSGSAADSQAVQQIIAYRLNMLSMELGEPVTVKTAANDVKQICYNYRDSLSCGMIVGGWDRKQGGQVYCIPLGGMISREPITIGGSGSGYIYGFVDQHFKPGMDKNECVEFVIKAISQAIWRDGSSGGVIRIMIITEKGAEKKLVIGEEVQKYYFHK